MTIISKKIIVAILFFTFFVGVKSASAQPYTPGETLNPACAPGAVDCNVTTLTAQEEGVDLGGNVLTLNFTGGGVTSSILSGVVTVNVPAGWEVTGSDIFYDGGSVAIGTDTPVSSAILTLSSSTKGLLIPTNADPDTNITSPVDGLIAYDTTDDQFRGYANGSWASLGGISNLVEDTTPELGGNLDLNSKHVVFDSLPGTDLDAVGNVISLFNAGETLVAGSLVYLSSSGNWLNTTSQAALSSLGPSLIGIVIDNVASGQPANVAVSGSFVRNDSWNWSTLGGELCSLGAGGSLSEFCTPLTGDNFNFRIGYTVSPDVIYLEVNVFRQTGA